METLWHDLSYSVRLLWKNPGFTIVAILSLAIGIGANSAIFSVTNALILRPLPYRDADRLVILWNRSPGLNVAQDWFSPAMHYDIKTQNHVFDDTAISIGGSYNLTGQGTPERVDGARISSSLFPLLGAQSKLGRVFSAAEDEPGQPQTVILSHGFWQRRFGSDPGVIGKTLTLNGISFQVVGVMTPDFSLDKEVMPAVNAIERADVLLPLPMKEAGSTDRDHEDFNIFARLKPGVIVQQAQAEMDVIAERMKRQYPENYPPHGGLTISVVPLLEQVVGDIRLILYVLFGAVGFVLMVACANVANLLLSRAAARQKEIAIRTAVGASRLRILRQLLTESVLLSLAGGLFGLLMAILAVRVLRTFGPENIPRLDEVGVDTCVLAFTFLVSLIIGIVFGLVPALRASRVDLNEVLKEGGRISSGGAGAFGLSHHRLRKLLVIAEVALSLVLLIGAGLLVRSYNRIVNAHPGYNARNVLSLRLSLPASKYAKPEAIAAFYRQINERIKQLPGVEAVGVTYSLPMSTVAFAWEPIILKAMHPRWFARFPTRAALFRQRLESGKDANGRPLTESEKREFAKAIEGIEPVQKEFKSLVDRLPNMTFDHELNIDVGNREVQIKYLGRGNTAGDTIVYLPKEKILIAGDLLDHPVPYLGGGYPSELVKTLKQMSQLDAQAIVPGHGEVLKGNYGREYLSQVIDFVQTVVARVGQQVYQVGNGPRNLEAVREALKKDIDFNVWRQKFAGDDEDNRVFFDGFSLPGLVTAAYAEVWGR